MNTNTKSLMKWTPEEVVYLGNHDVYSIKMLRSINVWIKKENICVIHDSTVAWYLQLGQVRHDYRITEWSERF